MSKPARLTTGRIPLGAALAAQLQKADQVAVGVMGDGAANTGRTWESINLAVVCLMFLLIGPGSISLDAMLF